jgi:hypothetical protein
MSKNMMSILLPFSVREFGLSVFGSRFLPERLSNHCQGLRRTFSHPFHREIASGQMQVSRGTAAYFTSTSFAKQDLALNVKPVKPTLAYTRFVQIIKCHQDLV